MLQMTPSYQLTRNYINVNEPTPNIAARNPIYISPMPQQISSVPCVSAFAKPINSASLPMSSLVSVYNYQSEFGTPLMKSQHLDWWNVSQPKIIPPILLNDDMAYNCNFLGQLQGIYVVETPAGLDHVSVIIPAFSENEDQYAIVRRVCRDGDALPDQFIHREPTEFTLCSMDGSVEAVLRKGSNMKKTVKWQNYFNDSQTVWRRKGEVTFNFVPVDLLAASRRNSFSSIEVASTVFSGAYDSAMAGPNGLPACIKPELFQQSATAENRPSSSSLGYTSNVSFQNKQCVGEPTNESDKKELAIFEFIKAHCSRNSSLQKKLVNWAKRNYPAVSPEELSKMSEGRLWITANAVHSGEDIKIEESLQESLDDIKGAYLQIRDGVFKQPEPHMNEPGVQHRLLKNRQGCWRIETKDLSSGKWQACAKELPNGRWRDMKNNGKLIRVQLIPMEKILQKMSEGFMPCHQEVEKSIEFLFTSCNQKKLNGKLKGRNLKHSISNLKMKLDKQHALRFALQVKSVADFIARDLMELSY